MVSSHAVSSPRRRFRTIAGYLVAAVCLAWIFHDTQLGPMLRAIGALRWSLVGLAIAADIGSYAVQGIRWRLLLRPVGDLPWFDATQAIYAGLFASEILPMRPGEVLRAYVVSRRLHTNVPAVLPSVMVERLFDGVWLAVGVGATATFLPLPAVLLTAGDVLGGLILLATALFVYEILRGRRASGVTDEAGVPGRIARFRQGFQEIGARRETYLAFGLSLVLFAGQVLAFWLVMLAYGLDVNVWTGAAALIIVHLGTAVPNAPANVGTYQFFCVIGLTLFGIDKTLAAGFSLVVFAILTIPLWLLGFLALGRTGASLDSVWARSTRAR